MLTTLQVIQIYPATTENQPQVKETMSYQIGPTTPAKTEKQSKNFPAFPASTENQPQMKETRSYQIGPATLEQ